MRIILDECMPRPFGRELAGHSVLTVPQAGLRGIKNGELLKRLRLEGCEALITMDKNMPREHVMSDLPFGVVILRASSNRLGDLLPLVPGALEALATLGPGQVSYVTD